MYTVDAGSHMAFAPEDIWPYLRPDNSSPIIAGGHNKTKIKRHATETTPVTGKSVTSIDDIDDENDIPPTSSTPIPRGSYKKKRKPPDKSSMIWDYVTHEHKENITNCKFCPKIWNNLHGSTSNCRLHLLNHHWTELSLVNQQEFIFSDESSSSGKKCITVKKN